MAFPSTRGGVGARTSIAQLGRWLSNLFAGALAPNTSTATTAMIPTTPTSSQNGGQAPEPVAMALAQPPAQNTVVVAPGRSRARSRVAASKARASEHSRPTRAAVAPPGKTHKARLKAGAGKTRVSVAKITGAKKMSPKTRSGRSTRSTARAAKSRRTR
jgi:hypothetical protein